MKEHDDMTNHDLANLIFPNITKTMEDYEKEYPARNLKENACVTRFAPSPTGFVHIGNFQAALIDFVMAKKSGGVFYLRNEDTDKSREVDQAVEIIMQVLRYYGMEPDEYEYDGKVIGNYGPYIQSERKEIYHAGIKHLIEIGRAYPCFCEKEHLDQMRENQEKNKMRTGYYGRYATCRNMSVEEAIEKIKAGIPYVIRFRSNGNFDDRFWFDDLVRGKLYLNQNDQDIVIMKSDNLLPTYHFAHIIDDHFMHTTHVVRGEEWLPSVAVHIELFEAMGWTPPKYIHTPLILKQDGEIKRKISKRKDPEALMSYYMEKGYPVEAVIEALMTIINSNYEEWHTANPDKSFLDFDFQAKKMSSSGGALFDLEKLNNISKNIISKMDKETLYQNAYEWSKTYSDVLKNLIEQDPEYFKQIINIEREQKKPRKDYETYASIPNEICYMYDDLFEKMDTYDFQKITDKNEIATILKTYIEDYYDEQDDKDTWFQKIKELTTKLGYCADMKAYKENPEAYKGSVADISTVIRVALTTRSMTPDLYELLRLLGKERIEKRFKKFY